MIVLFTKFDALDNKAYGTLIQKAYETINDKEITLKDAKRRAREEAREEARNQAPHLAEADFRKLHLHRLYNSHYPPKNHVYLRGEPCFSCITDMPQLVLRYGQTASNMP